jgi:predicted transport protein
MAKTPAEMEAAILKNIPVHTGITLDEWVKIIKAHKLQDKKELRRWLKEEKGLGNGQANILSAFYLNGGQAVYGNTHDLLENQYTEEKAQFRPLYDKIVKELHKIDPDIRFEPCKTYVSIIAKNQFAVAMVTNSEIKLGLALSDDVPANDVLRKTKNLASEKITHYVSLKQNSDIKYALGFVKVAYQRYR